MLNVIDPSSLGITTYRGAHDDEGAAALLPPVGASDDGSPQCAAYRPAPAPNGSLQVDPDIYLPSPGLGVLIAQYFNSNAVSPAYPYGLGRTISPNMTAHASGSPLVVTMVRSNGRAVTYQSTGPGQFFSATAPNFNTLTTFVSGGLE